MQNVKNYDCPDIGAAQRERHIPAQINRLRHVTERLDATVSTLTARLDIAARPSTPTPEGITGKPRELLAPMASEIESEVEKLSALNDVLKNLLERLEL